MKRIILALVVLAFTSASVVTSCKKDSPVNCTDRAKKYTDAATAYYADQSSDNCKAYKSETTSFLNSSCADQLSASEKQALLDDINALTCP